MGPLGILAQCLPRAGVSSPLYTMLWARSLAGVGGASDRGCGLGPWSPEPRECRHLFLVWSPRGSHLLAWFSAKAAPTMVMGRNMCAEVSRVQEWVTPPPPVWVTEVKERRGLCTQGQNS